jgi:MPBQ/MSBQ methyltransferase
MTANTGPEVQVAKHYSSENLEERVLAAFESTGKPRDEISAADLSAMDEFHIGGREATEAIAAQMKLRPGMHLLDVGSGIGGPARFFASKFDCRVTGIDLTEEFVRAATALTGRVGLAALARFEQGSALELPFAEESFDGAYIFHVGMNLVDKRKLFREVKRVLRPGSILAIYDVMGIADGELHFPVPWATSADHSFVAPVQEYRSGLQSEGFRITAERERRAFAIDFFARMRKRLAEGGPRALGTHLLMGADAEAKRENLVEGLQKGIVAPVEIIAQG